MPALSPRAPSIKDSNISQAADPSRIRSSTHQQHSYQLDTGNGPPGLRPDYGFSYYAAYLIDPDGYRIEAYFAE